MTHHASIDAEIVGVITLRKNFIYGNTPRGSVADVVLAVTECAFAVFPGFAPVDRAQSEQRRYRRKQHL